MKKSFAVLGLGKFGMSLVRSLNNLGAEVLAVDQNEALVKEIANSCSEAVCADLTNEENLNALGLKDMDVVVVAIGRSLEANILAVAEAKEQGVPLVVAKSTSERMTTILRMIGADKVIMPEEYAGNRTAMVLASETMLDYFLVDENLCMIEMKPLSSWVGKSVIELNIRKVYQANVLAEKSEGGSWVMVDPEQPLKAESELLIMVEKKDLEKLK